ncbi:MAG: hypothetical protein KA761_05210 [Gemmatimonadaceae bacterium]|nr:hypothetical protein [Gemmatimonadaceae bacterium]
MSLALFASSRRRWPLVTLLLAALTVGSPSLGGAYRCCAVEGHGAGGRSHAATPTADEHAHHRMDAEGPATPEAPAEPCSCVGPCHFVLLPAPSSSASVSFVADVRPSDVAAYPDADAAPRDRRLARALPFANGPPATPTV